MKKTICLGLICLMCLCGCGKIPKLENGKEAVITFKKGEKEHKISAEELFAELKDNFGLEATLKIIDTYILETEFKDYVKEAEEYAESTMDAMLESYGSEDALLADIKQYTNYTSIDAYEEYVYLNYLQSHAIEEYAKDQITDEEVEDYYKNKVKGDVELYHILVTPKVTSSMKDSEKKEAENKAKETVNDIIKKLKEASEPLEEFKKLVKEYSEDDSTKGKDGNLGFISYGDLSDEYDELLDAAYKLKDGSYSTTVITTELGYHVIYRNASKEKEELKDMKKELVERLANELMSTDKKIAVNSMKYYRELYNLDIIDSELDRQYGIYMNNLANQATEQQ